MTDGWSRLLFQHLRAEQGSSRTKNVVGLLSETRQPDENRLPAAACACPCGARSRWPSRTAGRLDATVDPAGEGVSQGRARQTHSTQRRRTRRWCVSRILTDVFTVTFQWRFGAPLDAPRRSSDRQHAVATIPPWQCDGRQSRRTVFGGVGRREFLRGAARHGSLLHNLNKKNLIAERTSVYCTMETSCNRLFHGYGLEARKEAKEKCRQRERSALTRWIRNSQ
jgi:hypothetical protein